MVVAELALTLVLLVGAGLMVRSFLKLYALDIGFDSNHMLTMRTVLAVQKYQGPDRQRQFFDAMLLRVRAIPGVSAAAIATSLPLNGGDGRTIEIEGRPNPDPKQAPRVSLVTVSPGYFDVLGATPRTGRDLRETDGAAGAEVVVVNERLVAKYFRTRGSARSPRPICRLWARRPWRLVHDRRRGPEHSPGKPAGD